MLGCSFATNVYEKTYRHVLAQGFIQRMVDSHHVTFDERTLIINNVNDRADVTAMAQAAIERGEIDRYVFVEDELPNALRRCGLRLRDLGSMPHYTDLYLVAITTCRTAFLLFQNEEFVCESPLDWVTPAVALLRERDDILHVNPAWNADRQVVIDEGFARDGEYVVGYGFTEGCVVVRPEVLAAPIYKKLHLASWRYPFAAFCPVWEQWIDSYMRLSGTFRYTDLRPRMYHIGDEGSSYPRLPLHQRAKRRLYRRVSRWAMTRSNISGRRRYTRGLRVREKAVAAGQVASVQQVRR
jgi:hypothetical protein